MIPNQSGSEDPDWSREALKPGEWNPGKRLLASLRDYQRHATAPGAWAQRRKKWAVLRHRFWSTVSGAESCSIARSAVGSCCRTPMA